MAALRSRRAGGRFLIFDDTVKHEAWNVPLRAAAKRKNRLTILHDKRYPTVMAFHTADYDVYVLLGDPAAKPIWWWENWRQFMPDMSAMLQAARGPASMRSTQYLPNRGGTVKFGRIRWNERDQQKWTHGSPVNLDSSPRWSFLSAELWAPAWTQCARENCAPDVFMGIKSERMLGNAATFEPVIVFAIVSEIASRDGELMTRVVARIRELVNPKLVAHQHRPWGRSLPGGVGFTNSIQDLYVNGLFKPGPRQERAVGLDLFAETWEQAN